MRIKGTLLKNRVLSEIKEWVDKTIIRKSKDLSENKVLKIIENIIRNRIDK